MNIDAGVIVTATEANQNLSQPKPLIIDFETEPQIEMTEDEKIDFVAMRILTEHKKAFEELAK
ncbi:MAG: hypothetical protein J6X19_07285 [Clostridia bacterium]|nr:hypothetical protein [Clostridia bacterium]